MESKSDEQDEKQFLNRQMLVQKFHFCMFAKAESSVMHKIALALQCTRQNLPQN